MSKPDPDVHVMVMGPVPADPVGHLTARTADGLDAVEINLRFDGKGGTRKALRLLAKAAIEVVVQSREITPVVPPEHEPSREMEGARWNG